jgi:hypothetical protein
MLGCCRRLDFSAGVAISRTSSKKCGQVSKFFSSKISDFFFRMKRKQGKLKKCSFVESENHSLFDPLKNFYYEGNVAVVKNFNGGSVGSLESLWDHFNSAKMTPVLKHF